MLANILIGIGIITGLLGVLDKLILSDSQKKSIASFGLRVWDWLDGARRNSLAKFLNRRAVRLTGVVIGALYIFWHVAEVIIGQPTMTITMEGFEDEPIIIHRSADINDVLHNWQLFLITFVTLLIASWLSSLVIARILRRPFGASFIKASTILVAGFVVVHVALDMFVDLAKWLNPDGPLEVSAVISSVLFTFIGGVIVIPVLLFYVATLLLFASEFLVRRIVEQSGGPLAAFSSLTTAAGAILKAFS